MLMAITGSDGLAAGELMVSQSVTAAVAEFIATPIVGQLSDSRGRRRVLVWSALGSAALRGLVVFYPCLATVWVAKLGDALVCKALA
jgi:MFS family permease